MNARTRLIRRGRFSSRKVAPRHAWSFGDGGTSAAANPSHTYSAAGTYAVTETVTDNSGASASKSQSVTVPSGDGGGNTLTKGVAVGNLTVSAGKEVIYTLVVPIGASSLGVNISGGSGDADLYVKFGSAPTDSSYDCRPYTSGNGESCSFASPAAGTYYVRIKAYASFSGVSLVGDYTVAVSNQLPIAN